MKQHNNVYLFQPQHAVIVNNRTHYWLPYSVGCIWAYAATNTVVSENFNLADLIFAREPLDQLINRLDNPKICGFSCYVWNERYCLSAAKKIKEKYPQCQIIAGGPQVNKDYLDHEFIDTIILGEGEENFLDYLTDVVDNQQTDVYEKKRLLTLEIPSPYSTGMFDNLVHSNPDVYWNMTLETNRGCPYSCTFCDWGSLTYSKVYKFELEKIQEELNWAAQNRVAYIFCADANFGMYKERDLEIARMVRNAADIGDIDGTLMTYAKNSNEIVFEIAKTLGDLSRGVTVSLQSLNDDTLRDVKRKNMAVNNIKRLLELSEEYQVGTYTELILGLPNESLESWINGLDQLLQLGQHNAIDVHFCQLIKNSELNSPESRKMHGISTIVAKDYMTLTQSASEPEDLIEKIELVNQTNTMSTNDLVEAYMWSWIIIQFHTSGYSQIWARYCFNIHNISYREFYQAVKSFVMNHSVFREQYFQLEKIVKHYMLTGENLSNIGSWGFGADSFKFMYDNKDHIYNIAALVAKKFNNFDSTIDLLQRNFIYNEKDTYPKVITTDWDITTWKQKKLTYHIIPNVAVSNSFDFYLARRRGFLRNQFNKKS